MNARPTPLALISLGLLAAMVLAYFLLSNPEAPVGKGETGNPKPLPTAQSGSGVAPSGDPPKSGREPPPGTRPSAENPGAQDGKPDSSGDPRPRPGAKLESIFEGSRTSGGLWIQLAGETLSFEVVAIAVARLGEWVPPDLLVGKPSPKSIRSRSDQGRAFVPYLGSERICAWIRCGDRQGSFESLACAPPPSAPESVTLSLASESESGGVHGIAQYTDGSPASGVVVRGSPPGASTWEPPLDVASALELRAWQGVETTTNADGRFRITGLPTGEGGLLSVSVGKQVVSGKQGVLIAAPPESGPAVLITIPKTVAIPVEVVIGDLPVPGLVLALSTPSGTMASVRCDADGRAQALVADTERQFTLGFSINVLRSHREVLHRLVVAGFPPPVQNRLFDLYAQIGGTTRKEIEKAGSTFSPIRLDLEPALRALASDGGRFDHLLSGVRRAADNHPGMSASLRGLLDQGDLAGLFREFILVFGSAAAAVETR